MSASNTTTATIALAHSCNLSIVDAARCINHIQSMANNGQPAADIVAAAREASTLPKPDPQEVFARHLSETTRLSYNEAQQMVEAMTRSAVNGVMESAVKMLNAASDAMEDALEFTTGGLVGFDTTSGDDMSVAALYGVDASGAVTMQELKTLGDVVIDDSACKDPNLANLDEAFSALSWDGPSYSLHDLAVREVINDEVERELARIARIDQPKPADHDAAIHAAMTSPPGPAKR
ncbi:MAG: hypothetical protein AAFY19_00640 [Pseudomonadota bacterium]